MTDRPVLDPTTVAVSAHACKRWLQRHGDASLAARETAWDSARDEIRTKLATVVDQSPPLQVHAGKPARRFVAGRVCFILSPDLDTVITVLSVPPQVERRKGKHAPRKGGRRPRFEDVDDGTDLDDDDEEIA